MDRGWVVVVNVCIAAGFALLHTGLVAIVYHLRIRRARKDADDVQKNEMTIVSSNTPGKKKNHVNSEAKLEISRCVSNTSVPRAATRHLPRHVHRRGVRHL